MLTFAFVFYVQFGTVEESTDQEVWSKGCRAKFNNCSKVINITTTTSAQLQNPKRFEECIEFFKVCTQTEPEKNPFNDWTFLFKTLAMAAGELGFDDLAFDRNPMFLLTFALFAILVLFVIMNLMTSLAVNDIHELRNKSRDGAWYKLMISLMEYESAMPNLRKKRGIPIKGESNHDENKYISFKLNEVRSLDPSTWFNDNHFFTRMPASVNLAAKEIKAIVKPVGRSSGELSITHNMDNLDKIVIITGTRTIFTERLVEKGKPMKERIKFWRTQFAVVDCQDGYDSRRKLYRAQRYTVSEENSEVEIKFKPYESGIGGQFEVWDQTGKKLQGDIIQYVNAQPTGYIKHLIKQYANVNKRL